MAEIIFLRRNAIDLAKWDACINADPKPQVYGYSWYLDAICNHRWGALILGNYEAVFPLPYQFKLGVPVIYQPFFCQQLGLFSANNNLSVSDFLRAIPRYFLKVHLQLRHFGNTADQLPQRTNYLLPLHLPYEEIRKGYNEDGKKNLRKAAQAGIEIKTDEAVNETIALYKKVWGPSNPHVKEAHYAAFTEACFAAARHQSLVCVHAAEGEALLARAIFLKSPAYLHYVCAAPTEAGRQVGIMHSMIDYAVQTFAGSNLTLDFEGSELDSVAAFYRKFGPERSSYGVFTRSAF